MLLIVKILFLSVSIIVSFQIYCHVISQKNKFERHNMCLRLALAYGIAGIVLFIFKEAACATLAVWLIFLANHAVEIGKNRSVDFSPKTNPKK